MDNEPNINRASLARSFAEEIVRQLVEAGHTAYFAGGCVRDQIRGVEPPDDYDVATSASPQQVTAIFGKHRTIQVGVSFGVVCVRGRRDGLAMQVEVATFREDGTYSDGRHPDSVKFSTPELDAQRRDFTINGIFFDPILRQVIDYVGGTEDIQAGIVRAIGDPKHRFTEDKLRMLRAIRFAARFGYAIEPATEQAIIDMASQIEAVSPERIAMELRKTLTLQRRDWAIEKLVSTHLLRTVLPPLAEFWNEPPKLERSLDLVRRLNNPDFCTVLAAALFDMFIEQRRSAPVLAMEIKQRWRLSNDECDTTSYLLSSAPVLCQANQLAWSQLQPILIQAKADQAIALAEAILIRESASPAILERCKDALQWPREKLDPPPLINGKDLYQARVTPGPMFAEVLAEVRNMQLDGQLTRRDDALHWLERFRK